MKIYTLTLLIIGASLGAGSVASAAESASKPPKTPKFHLTFEQADVDHNGGLTVFEFATTQGPGTPLVEIRRRFLGIDVSGAFEVIIDPLTGEQALDPITGEPVFGDPIPDGLVTLEELKAYRALEEKPKSDLSRFELADFDGDGQLSPVEFGYLVSARVPVKNVLRKFDKLDTDDDGYLSKKEFKKPHALDL
ncbi:MAG: hypothetical protein ABIT37_20860 [Luteolibacter sp.]